MIYSVKKTAGDSDLLLFLSVSFENNVDTIFKTYYSFTQSK